MIVQHVVAFLTHHNGDVEDHDVTQITFDIMKSDFGYKRKRKYDNINGGSFAVEWRDIKEINKKYRVKPPPGLIEYPPVNTSE